MKIQNNDEKYPSRFPVCLDYTKGQKALEFLKKNNFVSPNTEPMNFLYQMGCTDERPKDIHPIVWLKTKQLLRELLEFWFKQLINDKAIKKRT